MKEVKVICPECKAETTYYRDNVRFYSILAMIICISFAIGVLVKDSIMC